LQVEREAAAEKTQELPVGVVEQAGTVLYQQKSCL
jgi:hypothetical protein